MCPTWLKPVPRGRQAPPGHDAGRRAHRGFPCGGIRACRTPSRGAGRRCVSEEGLREIAAFAEETNTRSENIGARRLYTILEKILSDISFEAPDRAGQHIVIDKAYVSEHLEDVKNDVDLQQFIL